MSESMKYTFEFFKTKVAEVTKSNPVDEDIYWMLNHMEAIMIFDKWDVMKLSIALQDGCIGYRTHDDVEKWLESDRAAFNTNEEFEEHLEALISEFFFLEKPQKFEVFAYYVSRQDGKYYRRTYEASSKALRSLHGMAARKANRISKKSITIREVRKVNDDV
jgi:hypothetical protein